MKRFSTESQLYSRVGPIKQSIGISPESDQENLPSEDRIENGNSLWILAEITLSLREFITVKTFLAYFRRPTLISTQEDSGEHRKS